MIDQAVLEKFKILIQNHCGMMITDVHSQQLEKYLTDEITRTGKSCSQLYDLITASKDEMVKLINAVVVNETYFFREEKQFKFLQEYISTNFNGKEIVIWSAASSSGEEAYSLTSLALACNAKPIVYATDIDTDALMQVKNGVYGSNSFRPDGSNFKQFLQPYLSESENSIGMKIYSIKPELKEKILCGRANLVDMNNSISVPEKNSVDIIFIRNVFIYFDKPTRDKILKNLSEKLKEGGLLFFSISEIAGINPTDTTLPLTKKTKNSIYYFEKETVKKSDIKNCSSAKKTAENKNRTDELMKSYFDKINTKEASYIQQTQKTKIEPSFEFKTPEELWEKITQLTEKKFFTEATSLLENYKPSVNQLYIKYFSYGFIYEAQKNEEKALEYYEKASLSNPHFWPGSFKTAMLLQNKTENNLKRKRHDALIKSATILEEGKTESECYTYLMGAFSSSYFYQLCNDYLKKELS